MKIAISTIIDVPDELLDESNKYGSAVQAIFDEITNSVTTQHYIDAINCFTLTPTPRDALIFKNHQLWGDICKNLKWKYEEVK